MATKIRGTTDEPTRMLLGQIRKVFDPHWIQGFNGGNFTIQFQNTPDAEDELIRFMKMYGYELSNKSKSTWVRYDFN